MNAFQQIQQLIGEQKSFLLEAGAGSGKTFTLIQTLNHVLLTQGKTLQYNNRLIGCITYTNVAKNEIIDRLENNPYVAVLTIHEFLWAAIRNFQKQLLIELDILNEEMALAKPEKFQAGLLKRVSLSEVIYEDSGFRDFEKGQLHHDDVITLAAKMINKYDVLRNIIVAKYPFTFIDEYQDTAEETAKSLINGLLSGNEKKLLLGFFGDSYQKIYDSGVGSLESFVVEGKLELVTKSENYRSSSEVIQLLNNIRSNIKQVAPEGKEMKNGSVAFINCDTYVPQGKMKVMEYEKMLSQPKNQNYDSLITHLESKGWQFGENSKDKVLIIANRRVAERAKFASLYNATSARYGESATDALMKRENALIRFFVGSVDKKTSKERKSGVEHLIAYWNAKDYNGIISFLKAYGVGKTPDYNKSDGNFLLHWHLDKIVISEKIQSLEKLRMSGTVKQVMDFVKEHKIIRFQEGLQKYLLKLEIPVDGFAEEKDRERQERDLKFFNDVMALPYVEFINLFKHTQNQTVFSTKHGTKGEQFRNVLVVIDDTSWKQMYNFQNFINDTDKDQDRKLRTKNLFYVSCSRSIENLVVIALSEFSAPALNIINSWFPKDRVFSIDNISSV
jgi:DNA helicase-2/ATP-dependent DNA helicase PcrA